MKHEPRIPKLETMTAPILYVYALGRSFDSRALSDQEAVDGGHRFDAIGTDRIAALVSPVDREEFSQERIDLGDLEWLGNVAVRHQEVVARLASQTNVIPLRAFTLFGSERALLDFLDKEEMSLLSTLARIEGKEEWTLRLEIDLGAWIDAIAHRDENLAALMAELATASPGKRFLLERKLEQEKSRAAREAEADLLGEIETRIVGELDVSLRVEDRVQRKGASPQISLLVGRGSAERLDSLRDRLETAYAASGVKFTLSGPWPPYSFVGADHD